MIATTLLVASSSLAALPCPTQASTDLSRPVDVAVDPAARAAVAELCDRVLAARGGGERFRATPLRELEGVAGFVGYAGDGAWYELFDMRGATRLTAEFPLFGSYASGVGGSACELVWEHHPVSGARVKNGDDAEDARRAAAWISGVSLANRYRAVGARRTEDVAGRPLERVVLTPLVGDDDVVWFDPETGLPARLAMQVRTADGTPTERVIEFEDWRAVDGVRYPFLRRIQVTEVSMEVRLSKVTHPKELPADAFAVPEPVLAAHRGVGEPKGDADTITIEDVEEQHVACVRVKCKPDAIGRELGVIFPEILVHLNAVGARSLGAPYTRYHAFGPDEVDLEAGIPVHEPVTAKGRIRPAQLPAGRTAVAWHVGSYDTLGETHERLDAWIEARAYGKRGPRWEVYWTDPGMEPDPTKWRTQILWPIEAGER